MSILYGSTPSVATSGPQRVAYQSRREVLPQLLGARLVRRHKPLVLAQTIRMLESDQPASCEMMQEMLREQT